MFRLADNLRVYLHRDPIDFRAGINGEMGTTEPRTVLFAVLKLASIRLMLRRLCSK